MRCGHFDDDTREHVIERTTSFTTSLPAETPAYTPAPTHLTASSALATAASGFLSSAKYPARNTSGAL